MHDFNNDRVYYLDILRIMAVIAVILLHASSQNISLYLPSTIEWNIFSFFKKISSFGVPLFCCISGSLFLNKNKYIDIKRLYSHNILKIIVAYICWSSFYALTSYEVKNVSEFILLLINGHFHMWFLVMIVGFYIIVPILREITKNEIIEKYFLFVSFAFTFVFPFLLKISKFNYLFGLLYNNASFFITLGYTSYFVLGDFLNNTNLDRTKRIIIYILGIASLFVSMLYTYYTYDSSDVLAINGSLPLYQLFETIAVFVFVKYYFKNRILSVQREKLLQKISKATFGIYLVHVFVMDTLRKVGISTITFNAFPSLLLVTLLTTVISLVISLLLNRISIANKYIV